VPPGGLRPPELGIDSVFLSQEGYSGSSCPGRGFLIRGAFKLLAAAAACSAIVSYTGLALGASNSPEALFLALSSALFFMRACYSANYSDMDF
jgi:hypothetical protein